MLFVIATLLHSDCEKLIQRQKKYDLVFVLHKNACTVLCYTSFNLFRPWFKRLSQLRQKATNPDVPGGCFDDVLV